MGLIKLISKALVIKEKFQIIFVFNLINHSPNQLNQPTLIINPHVINAHQHAFKYGFYGLQFF
jgi:hypothetical protein